MGRKPVRLVTGGAGFIGSHLVDALLLRHPEERLRVVDNLSTGSPKFLAAARATRRLDFVKGDCLKLAELRPALGGIEEVWHLAADPDVRRGATHPWENFRDGALATFYVLDEARRADAKRFVLASSSTVYGEATVRPTPEDYGPLVPLSIYGAAKLAAEGLTTAFAGTYGLKVWIYRFGNVVGPRSTHGILHDFRAKLRKDPRALEVLGDGRQTKSYLSASDCVEGMLDGVERSTHATNIFNLASVDATSVAEIAKIAIRLFGKPETVVRYAGGDRGWPGDVPQMLLDIQKMRAMGWKPRMTSREALEAAARSLTAG